MPPPVEAGPEALRSAPAVRAFAGLSELLPASPAARPAPQAPTSARQVPQPMPRPMPQPAAEPDAEPDADEAPLDDDTAFAKALAKEGGVQPWQAGRVERAVRVSKVAVSVVGGAGARDEGAAAAMPVTALDPFLAELADVGVDMPRWAGRGHEEATEQLARGAYRIDAHVDLHGLQRVAAIERLNGAIADAAARGHAVLRVVHGRGLHSPGGQPALRDAVRDALVRPPLAPMVRAWSQALPADGGPSATLVLLSNRGLAGKRSRR